jgi:KaiC/GvpD/RAD55 family RecA-like ATPase
VRSTSLGRQGRSEKVIRIDPSAERVALAAMLVDETVRSRLLRELPIDAWQLERHRKAVTALADLDRRHVTFDVAAIRRLYPDFDTGFLAELLVERPEVPGDLAAYVEWVKWDATRADVVRGPLADFLEEMGDPKADPSRIKSLARAIGEGFGAWKERGHIPAPSVVLEELQIELRARIEGRGLFPFGIDAIDKYEDGSPRVIPGAKPGKVTLVTGVPGSYKSTLACRAVLGKARQGARVLYGAFEMKRSESLELLAVMSLSEEGVPVSRRILQTGKPREQAIEMSRVVEERAERISRFVRFVDNPFLRMRAGSKRKRTNDDHLDLIEHLIEDSGAQFFVADLWQRILVQTEPDEVAEALYRQQEMCERLQCHALLLHQQRLKDVENRPDKRPTREGIIGSQAWVEVPDLILGTHAESMWKAVPANVLEVLVLKQRFAPYPLVVEVEFDPDRGYFGDGASVDYYRPQAKESEFDAFVGDAPVRGAGGRGRRGRDG